MPEIILHHYGLSAFSEKIRLAFGLKDMIWRSVEIPTQPPRPDTVALTGGYRRAPVVQVGADIYCDTKVMLPLLERMKPSPSLYLDGMEGVMRAFSFAFERFTFVPLLGVLANFVGDMLPPEILQDREKEYLGFAITKEAMAPTLPLNLQRLHAQLAWLKTTLADGRAFLFGAKPSAADLSCFHLLWLVRANCPPEADVMMGFEPLRPWYDRVMAIGHGRSEPMSSAEAVAIAARSTPADVSYMRADADPAGLKPGRAVSVTPDDNARVPVHGTLVAADAEEVVIRREDARAGVVHVHFPRAGFDVVPA